MARACVTSSYGGSELLAAVVETRVSLWLRLSEGKRGEGAWGSSASGFLLRREDADDGEEKTKSTDGPSSRKKRTGVGDLGAVATRTDGGRARQTDAAVA